MSSTEYKDKQKEWEYDMTLKAMLHIHWDGGQLKGLTLKETPCLGQFLNNTTDHNLEKVGHLFWIFYLGYIIITL